MASSTFSRLRIGIDIGGTFTDFVVYNPASQQIETFKLLSTPDDPAVAVLQGLQKILSNHPTAHATLIHGSTVATNALLERKGARTALLTTAGFRDVLQIGRQNRPVLYDLFADPPSPLVPEELRFEVNERISHTGEVVRALDPRQVHAIIPLLKTQNVVSVAVCLLFSFLRPEHEQEISRQLRAAGFLVSASQEILPEYREYERTSTTAVNAYVSPVLDKYLAHLEMALTPAPSSRGPHQKGAEKGKGARVRLRVMQSNGGNISPEEARRYGVRCILSGPAGGVVGSEVVARAALSPFSPPLPEREKNLKIITFDMGGTSTDVALIEGRAQVTTEAVVSGCPIHIPLLDIHSIGAGGGSIASVDPGGALRVGPESAGAIPGPACYGGGGELPTVTDAALVLSRLAPDFFLGGQMLLDLSRARAVLARLGSDLGLEEPARAALGVVQVVNAHMERALRLISVERGHDPREFTLLSFGGAGGLHAADLARGLGIPRVLVPPLASTLSAFGMLSADVVKDYAQTVMLPGETPIAELANSLRRLASRGREEVRTEGVPANAILIERFLDMRYRGQSYELTVPFSQAFLAEFHQLHQHTYGYANFGAPVEVVNLRVRATGKVTPPPFEAQPLQGTSPRRAFLESRQVVFDSGSLETPFYRAESLEPGNHISGPAVIVRADTTVLLGSTDRAQLDGFGNLIIKVGP